MKYNLEPANDGSGLYRVIHTKTGQIGGLVSNTRNLSQDGDCWIGYYARVTGQARVSGDAQVLNFAKVSGDAKIYGKATVECGAHVFGRIRVCGAAKITGHARVGGLGRIDGEAEVGRTAIINGTIRPVYISGNAKVRCGLWTKSPFYVRGSLWGVTHSGPRTITIGCQTHPFRYWLKHGRRLARSHQFTPKQYVEYSSIVRLIVKLAGGAK